MLLGRYAEGGDALSRALARPGGSAAARATAYSALGAQQWYQCDLSGMGETVTAALSTAREAGDPRSLGRAHQLSLLFNIHVDPAAANTAFEIALPLAQQADDLFVVADLHCDRVMLAMRADDIPDAMAWVHRSHDLTQATGNEWVAGWDLALEAVVAIRRGDLVRADAAGESSIPLCRAIGEAGGIGFGTAALAEARLLAGAPQRALSLVDAVLPECVAAAAYVALPWLMTIRGRALSALGDPSAPAALAEAMGVAREVEDPWQLVQCGIALARARVAAGESVGDLLAEIRGWGSVLGSAWVPAVADHLAGLATAEHGEAEDLQHAALARHVEHGYALDVVDCLEALAACAAAQESWPEAVRLLAATAHRRAQLGYLHGRSDLEIAARAALGELEFAAVWAEAESLDVEATLAYATRARGQRKRPSSGWASLTPMEHDVARLAARGLTNAEIGTKLFIAAGTAKVHLSNIYTKLNLANRAQLTAEVMRRQA